MGGLINIERRDGGVVLVTLDDPDRRNAMTAEMGDALRDTFAELATDADLRCAVLTGAGSAFSAGGDLAMLDDYARRAHDEGFDATASMRSFYERFLALRDLPVPVVAAVNGHAIGAGACVALACDIVVISVEARFGLNFSRIGIHPGMGGSWLLPRLAGRQRAAEMLYTGRLVTGNEAAAFGLAIEARPPSDVLPRSLEIAGEIALSAPQVVRQLKVSLRDTWERTLEEQLDAEASYQGVNYATEDVLEGLDAVRERRTPRFTGR
jgi:enoyl-CoA hydratase